MKVAIVTGSSKGIGKACALRLARDGYTVVVNYSSSDEAALQTLEQIKAEGGDGMVYKANVAVLSEVKQMVRDVFKAYGRIDVLVNNAGIVRDEYLLMMNPDTLDKCFDLNVKGYFYCAQQVAVKMYKQKSGVIINMSSVSSKFALAGQAVYSATKGAVNSFTQTLAKELGGYGIRVNAVAPGFVATEMIEAIPEETRKGYLEKVPLKRFASADEVANVVSALASDQFAYVTGQSFWMEAFPCDEHLPDQRKDCPASAVPDDRKGHGTCSERICNGHQECLCKRTVFHGPLPGHPDYAGRPHLRSLRPALLSRYREAGRRP